MNNLHSRFSYHMYNHSFYLLIKLSVLFCLKKAFKVNIMRCVTLPIMYILVLRCVCKALYISQSTLIHPFICSFIQSLSQLKYLLSTYRNQIPVLHLWHIVINTNSERSVTATDSCNMVTSSNTTWQLGRINITLFNFQF